MLAYRSAATNRAQEFCTSVSCNIRPKRNNHNKASTLPVSAGRGKHTDRLQSPLSHSKSRRMVPLFTNPLTMRLRTHYHDRHGAACLEYSRVLPTKFHLASCKDSSILTYWTCVSPVGVNDAYFYGNVIFLDSSYNEILSVCVLCDSLQRDL